MTKIALYPISVIYGLIIWLRNRFFDWGVFTSQPIPGKSICVGNLSVGGTGKSPHIGYLISTLSKTHQIQVLSRGYGRQTKGLLAVDHLSNPKTVGDEPIMLYNEYAKQAHFVAVWQNCIHSQRSVGYQRPAGAGTASPCTKPPNVWTRVRNNRR